MYYTGRGDAGSSKLFNSSARLSKSEQIFATLGALDELNSYLGLASTYSKKGSRIYNALKKEQNNLFILQAHFAKAHLIISPNLISGLEEDIKKWEKEVGPLNNFVVSGGSKLSAILDVSRTIARRAEREALLLDVKIKITYNKLAFVYLNRLSSWLYVLARLANKKANSQERAPQY
ncbi:cob(I)yrinic acid a,c-diamide adenosyltransferase [Candidatus Falkowbacteria bacterium]|nr:cob(I)yrinic acid a,c-diamide adenosyltransferase [Candidatus Falkowbacteria bacterium]